MTNENNGQDHASNDSKPSKARRQSNRILKRQVDWLMFGLASAGTALGTLGGILLNFHFNRSGLDLLFATLVIGTLTFHLYYRHSYRRFRTLQRLPVLITALVVLSLCLDATRSWMNAPQEENDTHGWLLPGTLPPPFVNPKCAIPNGALAVYFGDAFVTYSPDPAETKRVVMRGGDKDLLTITRLDTRLAISARIFDATGLLAQIDDNEFRISRAGNIFRTDRPDSGTLAVFDRMGDLPLKVEYLNPAAIRITGRFLLPSGAGLIVESHQTYFLRPDGTKGLTMKGDGACLIRARGPYMSFDN